jgi:3-phenylpropionate/cinnamic acid dioxygenase small subunit
MSSTLEKHTTGLQLLITRKKVILTNDCIHHVVDIYHI